MKAQTPFVLTIDVEPARHDVKASADEWSGFFDCRRTIDRWRERVLSVTGRPLTATWFIRLDGQIEAYGSSDWALKEFAGVLREMEAQGDEVGLYFHAYRPDGFGSWYQDYVDSAWQQSAFAEAVRSFTEIRGTSTEILEDG